MAQRFTTETRRGAGSRKTAEVDELMPVVYERLHAIAAAYVGRNSHDVLLEPAVLVNEAYLSITANPPHECTSPEHFLAVAASAMRRVLIDYARRRRARKRGHGQNQVTLEMISSDGSHEVDIRAVDEVLTHFAQIDERACRVVELRFFAGLTNEEVARVLGVSRKTIVADWARAREWLIEALGSEDEF